jgi:hypothetical protein
MVVEASADAFSQAQREAAQDFVIGVLGALWTAAADTDTKVRCSTAPGVVVLEGR